MRTAWAGCVLILSAGCPGENGIDPTTVISIDLSTEKDTLMVGDTLWLSTNFSNQFTIIDDGSKLDYAGNMRLALSLNQVSKGISPVDGADIYYASKDKYEVVMRIGSYDNSSKLFLFFPLYLNERYEFKVGIVLREVGLYMLVDATGSFVEEPYLQILQTFNVSDVNAHLVDPSFHWATYTIRESDYKGVTKRAYCFLVNEK